MSRTVAVTTATLWAGPDAPRPVDAPALAAPADVRGWSAALNTADRLGLHGRVLTQALLGEAVIVDEESAGWARVVLPGQPSSRDHRGYPGWLPVTQLADGHPPGDAATVTVSRPTANLHASPAGVPVVHDVSFATRLAVAGPAADDWLPVLVPGRPDTCWIPAAAADLDPSGRPPAAEFLAAAGLFRGLPYLWGGTSGLGLDCSGLVHLLIRRFGDTAPRDAHDQAAAGWTLIDPTQAIAGDLLFFARPGQDIHHVGICAGGGRMLHAPEAGRGIELQPLSPQRREHLVDARRW